MNSSYPSTSKQSDFVEEISRFNIPIPLGYKSLAAADKPNVQDDRDRDRDRNKSSPSVDSTKNTKPSLFPAANTTGNVNSEFNKAPVSYNWLNFSSISTKDLLCDLNDLNRVENEPAKNIKQPTIAQHVPREKEKKTHSASKSHKKKRKRSQSPEDLKTKIEKELISQNSKKVFIEDVGLGPEHAFRVDRKAEQTNLAFNCFNPVQSARCLNDVKFRPPIGLNPSSENDWLSGQRGKKKRIRRNVNRYCSKENVASFQNEEGIVDMSKNRLKLSTQKFQPQQSTPSEDFIPTVSVIKEKSKTENFDKSDSEEEDLKETTSKFITRKTSEYNQYLRENPKDEEKWMEFIKFQDSAIEVTFQDEQNRKISERAIFERKISVLDKALEMNPTSVKLVIAKMKLCEHYWESADLKKEWQKILFAHPNNIAVWENYLLYLQTHFSSFSFSTVVKGYVKCFAKLNSMLEGTFISHSPPPDLAGHMLHILLKFCQYLSQVGHREKALACFQAMIEFNFFTPSTLHFNMNLNDWLAFFEPFWDSNVSRFGEENAPGWSSFMANKTMPERNDEILIDDESEEDKIIQLKLIRHETWCRLEKSREKCHWLPWKPNISQSEDDCEDPDRMVLVDDISPFLFRLKSIQLKFRLIKTFFIFLGMGFEPHFQTVCQTLDCHSPSAVEYPSSWLCYRKFLEYKFEKNCLLPSVVNENLLEVSNTSFVKFVDQIIEKCIYLFDEPFKTDIQIQWLHLKRLQLLRKKSSNFKDYKKSLKDSRKFFKLLLKEESNRNKLGLWLEFVQLELENGHLDDAKKMIGMIISSHQKNVLESNDSLICKCYKLYSEIELVQNSNGCLNVLISLATGERVNFESPQTSTVILKVKSLFHRSVTTVYDMYKTEVTDCDRDWTDVYYFKKSFLIEWVPCCAIFHYINSGLQTAVLLYEGFIDKLTNLLNEVNVNSILVKYDLEQLYFSYIFLLLHHVNTTTVSLKMLRIVLDRALVLYPQNSHFLQLLVDLESRSHITGRLRRHFNKSLKRSCHPIICFYAVTAEFSRLKSLESFEKTYSDQGNNDFGSGILQKIRSYFERALECEKCQHCPLIWRMYLKFELENGDVKQTKAVFYRALQQCVWNKNLYLDATEIPDCLQEILDIMTEKEIRVRIPIEEVDLLSKAAAQQELLLSDS